MPARHGYHEDMNAALGLLGQQGQDNIRRLLLIGAVCCPVEPTATPADSRSLILARYPFNPAYHPWTQMTVYLSTDLDADAVSFLYYTLDDAATWTPVTLDNSGDTPCGDRYRGTYAVDLTGITAATWIGARATFIVDATTPGVSRICRSHVYLGRPGF